MEHEGSLQQSQQSATCRYPEPDQTSPYLYPTSLTIHFNIILLPTPRSHTCHMPQAQYTYLKKPNKNNNNNNNNNNKVRCQVIFIYKIKNVVII
jgi:hypothetical protein